MKSDFLVCLTVILTIAGSRARDTNPDLCTHSNSEIPREANATEECESHKLNSSLPGPLCYALFRNHGESESPKEVMGGCWPMIGPECVELSQHDDGKGACLARTSGTDSLLLCCCVGTLCNRNLQAIASVPRKSARDFLVVPEERMVLETVGMHPILYAVIPITVFIVVALLIAFVLKFNRRCQRFVNELVLRQHAKQSKIKVEEASRLSDVVLSSEVNRGSFGTVWKGWRKGLPVAVKISLEREKAIWLNETKVFSLPGMKHHPNILEFIDAGQCINTRSNLKEFWLLTAWREIGSLEEYLRANTVTRTQLLRLAESIANGLMYLHNDAVLSDGNYKPALAHRDIKSKNILLKDAHTACIADFGLAIVLERGIAVADSHCQTGTPRYMAPEVLEGAVSFDQQSFHMADIYAMALVIWEIMSRLEELTPIEEFRLPYEEFVGPRPSVDNMLESVVLRKLRPPIRDDLQNDECLSLIIDTVSDCWDSDADARLNASTVHERFQSLVVSKDAIDMPHV